MDIRMDILSNGQTLIYNQLEDGNIEEPCFFHAVPVPERSGSVQLHFDALLFFCPGSVTKKHPDSLVLCSFSPVSSVRDMYNEQLQIFKANKAGIVPPTRKQVQQVNKTVPLHTVK